MPAPAAGPGHRSDPVDLALHGARLGYASPERIAGRYRLPVDLIREALLDFEACGWVSRYTFAGTTSWSVTEAGRLENERRMAAELDRSGQRPVVVQAHADFRPLNRRFGQACTDWQVRPSRLDRMAFNDHTDWRWDERVLRTLSDLDGQFRQLADRLAGALARFGGYADRYSSALHRAIRGERAWVDGYERDSCHLVWIQFHEDLLATLGIPRGGDA